MSDHVDAILKTFAASEGRYLRELAEFVGIPSVSTDPAHTNDVRRAADWVAARLRKAGPIEVEVWETPRHPAPPSSDAGTARPALRRFSSTAT